ncbi:MAG: BatA and WFA domain-containing protein [Planctomycetota bacterium]|nr:BatA and WFA domain-containing protein [Planctomycetota bacterium]
MSWLNPSLLYFALLALVPVLLHFLLRERVLKVAFSAVRFLRSQSREMLARHRWLEWLLSALRVACVLVLVTAFARPFLADDRGPSGTGQRELIVMLDVSRSMLFGSRLRDAQEEAARLIETAESGTAVTVVTFADENNVAVTEAKDRGEALDLVRRARASGGGTDIAAALDNEQKRVVERRGRGEVHLFSDLQASGLSRNRDGRRLPPGYRFHVHVIGEQKPADNDGIAVEGGTFSSDITPKENNLAVPVRIFNRGKAREVEARLFVSGKLLNARKVAVPQNGDSVVTLTGTLREIGEQPGQIAVVGAPATLKDDDRFYFVARVVHKVQVAVVRQGAAAKRSDGGLDAAFFVVRGLNAGADSPFQAEAHDKLPALQDMDAVILANVSSLPAPDLERLKEFVRTGGGLLAGLGDGADIAAFNASLGSLMPARLRAWNTAGEDSFLVVSDTKHPLVAHIAGEGGDFSTARFRGSWDLKDSQGSHVILRFNDNRPAVLECHVGKGIVMLLACGLDTRSGDFPLRAVFVPFLRESVRLLLSRSEQQGLLAVGESLSVPPGGSIVLPDNSEQRAAGTESLTLVTREPGIYQVKSGARTELYAANANPRESDLTAADPLEVEKMADSVAETEIRRTAMGYERVLLPGDRIAAERRYNVGWWCLCALVVLVVVELVVAGAASRR